MSSGLSTSGYPNQCVASSLIEIGGKRLVHVRSAPLATKMVRCRERSDVPEADTTANPTYRTCAR